MGGTASRAGDKTGMPEAAEAAALAALRLDWGRTLDIGTGGGRWHAVPRGSGPVLTRASADGLAMALRVSYGRPR